MHSSPIRTARRLTTWLPTALCAAALVASNASTSAAQEARGAGPDARTPAAGTLRVGVGATWTRSSETYNTDGKLRPLGARFSSDTLGPGLFRFLVPVESMARTLTGTTDFRASLGGATVQDRHTFETTPFTLEYGITSRFALSAVVPLVTTASRVDVRLQTLGGEATIGFNPSHLSASAVAQHRQLLVDFDSAAGSLSRRLTTCAAQPAGSGCATVNANATAAQSLIAQSTAFANAFASLYGGRNGAKGALFVPLAASAAQAAINARIAGFRAQFAAFGAYAIGAIGTIGAPAPITASAFQRILTDSAYGIRAQPLGTVVRRGMGDVDLSAQFTWHDSYGRSSGTGPTTTRSWWRSTVIGTFRKGTGTAALADALIPLGTGDHQDDLEARSITDFGIGTRASLTAVVRYTVQASASTTLRIADSPSTPFPEAFRSATVTRDPGDEIAFALYPRLNLSEAMSIAGHYGYRSKGADAYSGTVTGTDGSGVVVTADARALDDGSAAREHRFGAIIAYSTVGAWQRGRARWPVEISIAHFQTTAGSNGMIPKLAHDEVQFRWYWRPFGRITGRITEQVTGRGAGH